MLWGDRVFHQQQEMCNLKPRFPETKPDDAAAWLYQRGCKNHRNLMESGRSLESRRCSNSMLMPRLHSSPESKRPAFRCKREWVVHARSAQTTSAGVVRCVAHLLLPKWHAFADVFNFFEELHNVLSMPSMTLTLRSLRVSLAWGS